MIERFINAKFHPKTLELIHLCNEIIEHLEGLGYKLTLRQLYYQLVQRNVIPNKQTEYKRLGEIINNARLAGLVDWDAIEDRTRNLRGIGHYIDPSDIIEVTASAFRVDKWKRQPNRIEVWVEKDALVGVVQKACEPLDVDYFSCRGYTSQSELYGAARRLSGYVSNGQHVIILHFGDHDPSGIDMTRDVTDRIELLSHGLIEEGEIEVDRIALNMNQVQRYHPPNNPAKMTDSRYKHYKKTHGAHCWELDALDVQVIDALITEKIIVNRDEDIWEEDVSRETAHRATLKGCASRWSDVVQFLNKPPRKSRRKKK